MVIGMTRTIVYLATFLFAYFTIFRCYKSEQKLNGVTWLMLSLLIELCIGAFVAGIINIANIPINLWSMSCVNLFVGGYLQYCCWREKRTQRYDWEHFDVFFLIGLFAVLSVFLIFFKGPQIQMKFYNSDAGVHLKNTMNVVRSEHLPTMYFSELWTAMAIKCFLPVIKEINAYKIFILADHFFLFLEIEMFMIIIREYAKTNQQKTAAVFVSILYVFGYPMLSYLYSFYYWGMGILLIGSLLLFAKYYKESLIERSKLVIALMLTCNAITSCYMLFGPFAFVILFLYLSYVYVTEYHKLDLSWMALCLKVFLFPTILAIYYCYFVFLAKENLSVGEVINTSGGTYVDRYLNFLWLIPLGIYLFVRCIKEREIDIVMTSELCNLLLIVVFMVLCRKGRISVYYFSKFFYPFWLFSFIIAFQAICSIMEHHSRFMISYCVVVLLLTIGYFGKYERQMLAQETDIETELHINRKLGLYGYNYGLYRMTYVQYADEYMKACDYVMKELKNENQVPMLAGIENYSHCFWYEAITGRDSTEYYGWTQEFSEIQDKLDSHDVDYFVIYKNTNIYLSYQDYFESFDKVYDNDLAMVCSTEK